VTWLSMAWARDDAAYVAERMLRDLLRRRYGPEAGEAGTVRLCPRCASTEHGRPLVSSRPGPGRPAVSIARTSGATVVAVTDCPSVGVDVEATALFGAAEVADVLLHPAERTATARETAAAWVRKEALLKASGWGLAVEPSTIRLDDSTGSPVVVEWPTSVPRPGWVMDVTLAADLTAAVAGSGPARPQDVTTQEAGPGGSLG
jgi:4'-phosphopantetheinyl transferase